MTDNCKLPPEGWWCSRGEGHEGPCAARPNGEDNKRNKMQHDKQCELYGGFFSCKCEQRRPRVGTTDNLEALYEKHEDEFCKFDRVKNKSTTRGDLHAFLLLDRLIPSPTGCDIVSAANHDEIYLDTDPEEFVKVATEDHVIEIMRCGVRFDGSGFQMFV